MSKPVLMIHEMYDEILTLPLENYILTFDDGLYSQYHYYEKIKHINTEKIFFISSGIICTGPQSSEFLCCDKAHAKAFNGVYEDYMTVNQIKELMQDPQVTIGGHGHTHTNLSNFDSLSKKINYISKDTETMLDWFETNLGFKPTVFCYPYNNDLNGVYTAVLKQYGITKFYGKDRVVV